MQFLPILESRGELPEESGAVEGAGAVVEVGVPFGLDESQLEHWMSQLPSDEEKRQAMAWEVMMRQLQEYKAEQSAEQQRKDREMAQAVEMVENLINGQAAEVARMTSGFVKELEAKRKAEEQRKTRDIAESVVEEVEKLRKVQEARRLPDWLAEIETKAVEQWKDSFEEDAAKVEKRKRQEESDRIAELKVVLDDWRDGIYESTPSVRPGTAWFVIRKAPGATIFTQQRLPIYTQVMIPAVPKKAGRCEHWVWFQVVDQRKLWMDLGYENPAAPDDPAYLCECYGALTDTPPPEPPASPSKSVTTLEPGKRLITLDEPE